MSDVSSVPNGYYAQQLSRFTRIMGVPYPAIRLQPDRFRFSLDELIEPPLWCSPKFRDNYISVVPFEGGREVAPNERRRWYRDKALCPIPTGKGGIPEGMTEGETLGTMLLAIRLIAKRLLEVAVVSDQGTNYSFPMYYNKESPCAVLGLERVVDKGIEEPVIVDTCKATDHAWYACDTITILFRSYRESDEVPGDAPKGCCWKKVVSIEQLPYDQGILMNDHLPEIYSRFPEDREAMQAILHQAGLFYNLLRIVKQNLRAPFEIPYRMLTQPNRFKFSVAVLRTPNWEQVSRCHPEYSMNVPHCEGDEVSLEERRLLYSDKGRLCPIPTGIAGTPVGEKSGATEVTPHIVIRNVEEPIGLQLLVQRVYHVNMLILVKVGSTLDETSLRHSRAIDQYKTQYKNTIFDHARSTDHAWFVCGEDVRVVRYSESPPKGYRWIRTRASSR